MREGDDERHRVRERRLHQPGEQRLADGAEEDREDGDADLHRRDETDGIVHEAQRRLRPATAPLRALFQARPPTRYEGVLGCHEDRVPQHEEEYDGDAEGGTHAPSGAPVLGGISSPTMIRRQYR